jgi:hypothetical protein
MKGQGSLRKPRGPTYEATEAAEKRRKANKIGRME